MSTDADRELYERAEAAAASAYAPYSHFRVGAAVRARDGTVFVGTNVENASYPLGICAERAALAGAVAQGYGPGELMAIGVTASPCGGCRQWLVEFDLERVIYRTSSGDIVSHSPDKLLPDTFQL
jgi:cytidine deaminase